MYTTDEIEIGTALRAQRRREIDMEKDIKQQQHYTQFAIQPMEFIGRNGMGFLEGNVIKYVCRYKAKNGLEDLKKAAHYLEKLIELTEKQTITL
jgi:hypothetical protein